MGRKIWKHQNTIPKHRNTETETLPSTPNTAIHFWKHRFETPKHCHPHCHPLLTILETLLPETPKHCHPFRNTVSEILKHRKTPFLRNTTFMFGNTETLFLETLFILFGSASEFLLGRVCPVECVCSTSEYFQTL